MRSGKGEWLTTEQAGQRLGVTTRALYALIDRGELPAYRIGTRIRLRAADVQEYLDRREHGGTGRPPGH